MGSESRIIVSLSERVATRRDRAIQWLRGSSVFFSRIAECPVTRLLVIRVHLATAALVVCAVAVVQSPLVSVTAALCAGWLVYRLNKKGGTL
jgi:hypothetical protein